MRRCRLFAQSRFTNQAARRTEEGMEADDLLCSRNARPQKALVGRAQWKINQPPSLEEMSSEFGRINLVEQRCSFDARSKGQPRPLPLRASKKGRKPLVGRAFIEISPAAPAQVARCRALPCRVWDRDQSLTDWSPFLRRERV